MLFQIYLYYITFVFIVSAKQIGTKEPCLIQLSSLRFKPFALTSLRNFLPSQNHTVTIENGQNVTFTCNQYKFDTFPQLSNIDAVCDNGHLISNVGNSLSAKDLSCEVNVINIMKCNVSKCPNDHIGLCTIYYDDVLKANIKIAETCFNININRINFVRILFSKDFSGNMHIMDSSEKLEEFTDKIRIMRNLLSSEDENRLSLLLVDDYKLNYDSITVKKIIPSGILNDQLQFVEKYPFNNVGLWWSVSYGNLRRIIEDIKNYIHSKNEMIDLIFGTHQTLQTHDGSILYYHKKVELIPQYIWTIVHERKSDKGVAIVTLNDPFSSINEIKNKIFCKNICHEISWLNKLNKNNNYDRPGMGYTFCCALQDFISIYAI